MAILDDLIVAVPMTLVVGAVVFVLGNVYFKQAFRREVRLNAIETLIKQLGIKDFKPGDLRADKLDDTGFSRLVYLIQVLYQTQSGGGTDALSRAMATLNQFNQVAQPRPQPTTP